MSLTTRTRLLLSAICAAAVATIYASQPVLAQVGAGFGVPTSDLGWIVTAGQVGYLLGLVLLVPLGDMVDRRALITGHLVIAAGGVTVAAVATRLWLLLAGLTLAGLFAVVVQTAVAYAAALSAPAERGRTVGVITSGVIIGVLGARVLAGVLAALWGWRSIYLVLAALLVVLALVTRRHLPADPRTGRTAYAAALSCLGRSFRDPLFVSRGLIAFFVFASFGTLWSGLALPLAAAPWRLSTARIGLFGFAGLAGAIGAVRAGRWADSGRAQSVTGVALALLAASWLASGQAPSTLWPVVLGVVVLDFAVQAVHVSNQHLLTDAAPHHTSATLGGYMIFYSFGSALGATATTTAYALAGWTASSLLGALLALCALVVWAVCRSVRRHGQTRDHGRHAVKTECHDTVQGNRGPCPCP